MRCGASSRPSRRARSADAGVSRPGRENARSASMRMPVVMALIAFVAIGPLVHGAETAREILDRRTALDDGTRHWTDRQQRLRFVILAGSGGERRRELSVYERRYPDDEIKSVVFFHAPAEVKGTALLAFTHKGRQ